ncbi:ras-domain-containing protein [Cutaneotrichosporon oleaginosum]|uniref:Ras-domain-containing protein n=1 Tax=Cutaneotrichosporon oleaginosum TaxID=879819 RepID=A0A0J0XFL0_9TREE|nr:ras-domain-containing protein [Cutaneotrichosporon oleaginosum]KLT39841.1 ras-domain-containing protein [Cutaneotrichosporon oleaginosum]TXT05438.1 hypothetical protein COLE_06758 [Cutaneotrichosporon oleaginosum]
MPSTVLRLQPTLINQTKRDLNQSEPPTRHSSLPTTASQHTTPPENTLHFHRTRTYPSSINLPSPHELNLERVFRTKSSRGYSRTYTAHDSRISPRSFQTLSSNRDQRHSDSSTATTPQSSLSPPLGEYISSRFRQPSLATCSSRDSESTGPRTPPPGCSPRPQARNPSFPPLSPYREAPFIPVSPILSYRCANHPEPHFGRIIDRRIEIIFIEYLKQLIRDSQPRPDMANAPLKRKIVILGSPSVGKTSITQQYVTPPTYNEQYYPTIESTSNKLVTHKGVQYDCEIVDTAGQDEFSLFPPKYAVGVHGYILVYSITSRQSFDMITSLHEKILDQGGLDRVPCVIVGQKVDLDKERRVSKAEGEALAKKLGAAFLESSAKDNKNVDRAFEALLGEMQREYNPAPAPAKKGWWPWS